MGLPWHERGRSRDGVDCWGLVREVYRQQLGISLPSYEGEYTDPHERSETSAILTGNAAQWPWRPIDAGEQQPFDVIMITRGGVPAHVAIVVDAAQMLHVAPGELSRIERYDCGAWRRRIEGFYRHIARVSG